MNVYTICHCTMNKHIYIYISIYEYIGIYIYTYVPNHVYIYMYTYIMYHGSASKHAAVIWPKDTVEHSRPLSLQLAAIDQAQSLIATVWTKTSRTRGPLSENPHEARLRQLYKPWQFAAVGSWITAESTYSRRAQRPHPLYI